MASPLRVNAVELLRRPGTERAIDITVPVSELHLDDDRLDPNADVHIVLRLEALSDGIVVTGAVSTHWQGICRRCAVPASGPLDCEVHELYQQVVTDPEAFELGDQLDLEPMVREVVLIDAPASPLCRPDCQGLCPVCGIDRNAQTCTCDPEIRDPRWADLDEFRQSL